MNLLFLAIKGGLYVIFHHQENDQEKEQIHR